MSDYWANNGSATAYGGSNMNPNDGSTHYPAPTPATSAASIPLPIPPVVPAWSAPVAPRYTPPPYVPHYTPPAPATSQNAPAAVYIAQSSTSMNGGIFAAGSTLYGAPSQQFVSAPVRLSPKRTPLPKRWLLLAAIFPLAVFQWGLFREYTQWISNDEVLTLRHGAHLWGLSAVQCVYYATLALACEALLVVAFVRQPRARRVRWELLALCLPLAVAQFLLNAHIFEWSEPPAHVSLLILLALQLALIAASAVPRRVPAA